MTQTINITCTIADLNAFWVFNVYDGDDRLLYTGCERIRTIPTLRELKRHALRNVTDDTEVRIELITPVATEQEGLDLVDTLRAINMPLYGKPTPRQQVQCEQTGAVYANARQAALANGVNYSYIHQHLKRRPGFNSCKGLRFSYVSDKGE